jgi:hypothetical protein
MNNKAGRLSSHSFKTKYKKQRVDRVGEPTHLKAELKLEMITDEDFTLECPERPYMEIQRYIPKEVSMVDSRLYCL